MEWKESQLPKLIDSLKDITNDHYSELEKAVLNRGEWHFTAQYVSLVVSESWFSQMSDAAKKQHMKKVFSHKPSSLPPTSPDSASSASSSQASHGTTDLLSIPSVAVEECGVTNISESTLRNIWSKAQKLILDGHVVMVPWSSGSKDRLVKSSTSPQPHLVTANSKDVYVCDKNCQMFKGFSICSHVIATAHTNGDLKVFLGKVNSKCKPNLTAIANHGMPSGTGRKGVAKQKRNRKLPAIETRSVRPCLDVNEEAILSCRSASSTSSEQPDCPALPPQLPSTASSFPVVNASSITLPHSMPSSLQSSGMQGGPHTPSVTTISVFNDFRPRITTANASSHGQVFVGTNINCSPAQSAGFNSKKPFILKFKTNSIKICQSCRRNYEGSNDRMGLVARAERRLVLNLATGSRKRKQLTLPSEYGMPQSSGLYLHWRPRSGNTR